VNELPERMQQRIAGADANRDGVLSPEEMHTFFEARHAERLREMPPAAQPEAPTAPVAPVAPAAEWTASPLPRAPPHRSAEPAGRATL
jgi:hypothetical protein